MIKIFHGTIITVDNEDNVFNYLVVKGKRIVFVGNVLPIKYQKFNIEELGNKCIIPTFCDTHQHFASYSIFHSGLNVMDCKSNAEMINEIKKFSSKFKGKLLIAFGASPYSVSDKKLLSREDIDSACPDKMVVVIKYDGHACIVNSKLLNKLPEKIKTLRGYHSETGEMNQEAFFAVSDFITNSVSIPRLIKCMNKAVEDEIKNGIGEVHTVSGVGFPLNLDITTECLYSKFKHHGFKIRVFPQSMNINTAKRRHLSRIGGCFKCALDGCFGSQDAALNEPYLNDTKNYGVLYYTDEQVIEFCKKANRAGLQIEMHAIGDRAFNQATKALKAALDDFPRTDHRHGIIHCCLPTKEGIDICKKYNIQIPTQIAFDDWKQEPIEYCELILGKERTNFLNPIRTFMENDIIVSFGSDAPCTEPKPLIWLQKATHHSNPNESITINEALRMATYNGYWATFDEKNRGSLEKDKIADFIILSDNIYKADNINLIEIKKVYLSGKEI